MYRVYSSMRGELCLFSSFFSCCCCFSLTWLMVIWKTDKLSHVCRLHTHSIQDSYPSPLLPDCFLTRWQGERKRKKKKGVYFLTRIHLHVTSLLKIIICHFHLRHVSGTLPNEGECLRKDKFPFHSFLSSKKKHLSHQNRFEPILFSCRFLPV